jgi:hypothetical protein
VSNVHPVKTGTEKLMSPITHFLTGWVVANSARLDRRDRILVTLAYPLFIAVFRPLAIGMGWSVGIKCLAQYGIDRIFTRSHVLPGLEARLFSPGDDFQKNGRRFRGHPAAKIRNTANFKCLIKTPLSGKYL